MNEKILVIVVCAMLILSLLLVCIFTSDHDDTTQ